MKRRFASALLATALTLSLCSTMSMTVSAASTTSSYGHYPQPSSSDYAYWAGSYVVRAPGTTLNEVKWMQAALNYCIDKKWISATKLSVDGSFGPASKKATLAFQKAYGLTQDGSFGPTTRAKMLSLLNGSSNASSSSKISSSQIQNILDQYGYRTGQYWVYSRGGSPTAGYTATSANRGRSYSYNYKGSVECAGFAAFVMTKVTGYYCYEESSKWTKLVGKNRVNSLQVGDIVRAGGHSAIVLSVDDNGNCTFAECWGSAACKINIGKFNGSYSTLSQIKSAYSNSFSHVWRYTG